MRDFLEDFMLPVVISAGICVAFLGGVILLANTLASHSCHAAWRDAYETDYGFFSGCRIKVDGKWLPEGRYRNVEIGK